MNGTTEHDVVPVFFLSDSTGISAETMGNALLIQFPDVAFERTLIPFIHTIDDARRVVEMLDEVADGPVTPLVFTTAADEGVRAELLTTRAPIIDLFETHMSRVEAVLGRPGMRQAARLHGVGDIKRYNNRMAAVEFTIEHDDGQSVRALEKADVVLLAPSRCGKTPTSMYLALQHGLFVANYPLVDEDLEGSDLPEVVLPYLDRCFGLTTTVERLSRIRHERRPGSRYASPEQCRWELRRAEDLFRGHRLPVIDSSAKSVEEISALILQTLKSSARSRARRPQEGTRP
ncbi:pyruvate, water dikinase regulatory protein [Nocardioides sp. SYSU DS0663]|uniref:pyruvate, water dikinase regulatory protein n=1 Tax=Nocardioides sp. SYSU DS0663 TaxID=3416445 RepID=UPI003F4B8914